MDRRVKKQFFIRIKKRHGSILPIWFINDEIALAILEGFGQDLSNNGSIAQLRSPPKIGGSLDQAKKRLHFQ